MTMLHGGSANVVLSNLLFSISQVVIHSCLPQVILLLVCKELGLEGETVNSDEILRGIVRLDSQLIFLQDRHRLLKQTNLQMQK